MATRRRDRFFSNATRQKCAKLTPRRLAIGLAVAVVLAATVLLVLRFAVVAEVKADVEDARLNRFGFDTTKTLSFFGFNISIALKVRNPNKAMSIRHTQPLVAAFVFGGWHLCNASVADDGHRHPARKSEVHLLYPGGEVPSDLLGAAAAEEFNKQNATGVFDVEVITLGIGNTRKLSLRCPISLRLAPTATVEFRRVNCEPDEPQTNYF